MHHRFSLAILFAFLAISVWGFTPKNLAAMQPLQTAHEATEQETKAASIEQPLNSASDNDDSESLVGVTYSDPVKIKWKVTAKITGGSGSANNMLVTMPVPVDWPEQAVSVVEEDISATIGNVDYRELESGVRQLIASIPVIRPREEIAINVTFLVLTSQINPPATPSDFLRPKKNHRSGKPYTGVGPQINYRNSKLRKLVKEVVADKDNIWSEVEAIYDWVRDNIEDRESKPQDILRVFNAKSGCNEDKVGLFVAMCRAHKIPARMVWVEGTQYAEFMLVDAKANAHWFPCQVGGVREFGAISEPRIILQKGDSIRVPEKKERQKFVGEFATCKGRSKPSVKFSREVLLPE